MSEVLIPESIAAGRALEGGLWKFALTLAAEAAAGDYSNAQMSEALAEAGVTNTSGDPYRKDWIQRLIQLGTFVQGLETSAATMVTSYAPRIVLAVGKQSEWDLESMLLRLNGDKHRLHDIDGTSVLGKPDREKVRQELERLSAADRAALATDLVSQTEVREAILNSDPIAREQHVELTTELVTASRDRSERRMKETFPSHAASDAADEISNAANHLNNALAEIIQWGVTLEHDRLRRVESALQRVERATNEINEALERRVTAS